MKRVKTKHDMYFEELLGGSDGDVKTVVHYQDNVPSNVEDLMSDKPDEVFHDDKNDREMTLLTDEDLDNIEEEFGYRHNYLPNSKVVSFYDPEGKEVFHTPISLDDINMNFTLSEAYIGKEYVKNAFLQFAVVREKFRNAKYSPKMDQDPDVIKFNRAIEKTFGFSTFSLSISPDFSFNAYAIPIYTYLYPSQITKVTKSLTGNANGFKFSDYGKIVALSAINMGALESDLTNDELFAVMLHEIGHMFFEVVIDHDGKYRAVSNISNIISQVNEKVFNIISNGINNITNNDIANAIDKVVDPFLGKLSVTFANIKNIIKAPFTGVFNLYKFVKGKLLREAMDDNMDSKNKISYTNEKFADTFAAMYGYGTELHSALLKSFKNYEENNVPKKYAQPRGFILKGLKFVHIMFTDYMLFINGLKDEHPDGLTRINVSIQYLSREIAKENIDPKMKKELLDQINNLKKQVEDYIAYNGSEGDTLSVTRSYYIYLYKKFSGDRRESQVDNAALFKSIDDMLNALKG